MKVSITGANGFLGKHLVREALNQGHEVTAWVRSASKMKEFEEIESLQIIEVDYTSPSTILNSLESNNHDRPDLFIHNAGLTASLRAQDYYDINVGLTSKVISALNEMGGLRANGKFLFVSSLAAAGPKGTLGPVSHYGESKLQAEQLVKASGLQYQIFRITGIYGPGDRAFLPLFKLAKRGIYFNLAPRNQVITLVFAADLARFILNTSAKQESLFHISDKKSYSHKDVASTLELVLKKRVAFVQLPIFLPKLFLNISDLIGKTLGHTPPMTREKYDEISQNWNLGSLNNPDLKREKFTSLEEGFKFTAEYYKSQGLL